MYYLYDGGATEADNFTFALLYAAFGPLSRRFDGHFGIEASFVLRGTLLGF